MDTFENNKLTDWDNALEQQAKHLQFPAAESTEDNPKDDDFANLIETVQHSIEQQDPEVQIPRTPDDDRSVPTSDLDQYDEEFGQWAPQDKINCSLRYGFIGTGLCGARLVKSFYDLGYRKAVLVDTADDLLDTIDIPTNQKLVLQLSEKQLQNTEGMQIGFKAVKQHQQEMLHRLRQVFGTGIDHIMLCFGAGGDTGGGSIFGLIEIAKKYARYIGLSDPNKTVGVIMTVPAHNFGANPDAAEKAYGVANKLGQMASDGKISPLLIIDNNNINKVGPGADAQSPWCGMNEGFANLFNVFNWLSATSTPYTSVDPAKYRRIIQAGGCTIMGATEVERLDDPYAVSKAVKASLHKHLLGGQFDLTTAKQAGCIVVGDSELTEHITGLQGNIDYAFDILAEITGNATIHRGLYEDDDDRLKVYSIISGLTFPAEALRQLTEKKYTEPKIKDLEGLPLKDRIDDIIPMAKYFLTKAANKLDEPPKVLTDDAGTLLINYTWPGNVRELAEAMERAHSISETKDIHSAELPFDIIFADYTDADEPVQAIANAAGRTVLARALELTDNKAAAAGILGRDADEIDNLINQLGISWFSRKPNKQRQAKTATADSRAINDANPLLRIWQWLKSLINQFMRH